MASLDPDYELVAIVDHRNGRCRLTSKGLDTYFVPERDIEVTPRLLRETGRGVGYTKSATAYVFRRGA